MTIIKRVLTARKRKDEKTEKKKILNAEIKRLKLLTSNLFEAEINDPKTVSFDAIKTGQHQFPEVDLDDNIDPQSAYSLFSLFWPERMWDVIAEHINIYAAVNGAFNDKKRLWHQTNGAEIKVFVGALIYMGIHKVPSVRMYWNHDLTKGSIHTVSLHIGLKRFEQLRRWFHVSDPRSTGPDSVQDEGVLADNEESQDEEEESHEAELQSKDW